MVHHCLGVSFQPSFHWSSAVSSAHGSSVLKLGSQVKSTVTLPHCLAKFDFYSNSVFSSPSAKIIVSVLHFIYLWNIY